jgi:YD repeat-containing protein
MPSQPGLGEFLRQPGDPVEHSGKLARRATRGWIQKCEEANRRKHWSRAALGLLLATGLVTPILSSLPAPAYGAGGSSVVGDVYSIVGNGNSGTSGDNAQATEAELNDPISSAVDSSGNVYVADQSNDRIQEVAGTTHTQWGISMTAGDVYTIAGSSSGSSGHSGDSGVATSALLMNPAGVAVDSAGDLYIVDEGNHRIQEVAAATGTQWGISMTANDIYTIAGNSSGTSGSTGDGGAATSALLDLPRNVAFDSSGNLYISDQDNNRIQMVAKNSCSSSCAFGLGSTTANDIYTVAGSSSGTSGSTGDGGAATSALLNAPKGLAFDAAGNLYVVDANNNRLQEVAAATGTQWGISMTADDIYTVAGSSSGTSGDTGDGGAATSALLNAPRDVTLDGSGDLYIADGGNNRVQEIAAATGTQWGQSMTADDIYTVAGSSTGSSGYSGDGGPATSALFDVPGGIAIDSSGDLFITDEANNEVREVTANAAPTTALSPNDVYSLAGNTNTGTSGDSAQATEAEFNLPISAAVDAEGNVYVADQDNNRVQEIAGTTHTQWGISMTAGDVYTIAGSSSGTSGTSGDAGAATSALLDGPSGVAVDAAGDLYIADQVNNRIQEIAAATGTQWGISMTANDIYTVAGSSSGTSGHSGDAGAATTALLDIPRNVAFDAAGNLYIDDTGNNRVQMVATTTCSSSCAFGLVSTTANDIYTIAGSSSGTSGSTGDGGSASSALLSAPKGLAFDTSGNLYVVDCNNNRIQEIAASTSTQWGVSMTADDIYTVAGSSSGSSGDSGDGGAATSALLNAPRDITVDGSGDLYIADGGNNRIQEVSATTATQWGVSMTVDDIYTVAGSSSGSSGSSGDGGAATSALFNTPGGIAIDSAGDLFITDEGNNEVREVVPAVLAPTLPDETSGGGNPAEYDSQPQTPASTAQGQGLSTDAVTGTLSDTVTDFSVPGSGIPLVLTRTYDSARSTILGPFGYGWTDSYNMSLAAGTGSLSNTEQVTQENGSIAYFYQNENGTWTAPAREYATLVHTGSTWTFTRRKTSIFTFNSSGQLTQESDPNGYTTNLSYNAAGLLTQVTANEEVGGSASHWLIFSYNGSGLVTEVTDSQGQAVTYAYDGSSELTSVTRIGPFVRIADDVYSILGTGASGTSGDNAQATEAEMDSPISSAVDASGNVYVADEVNNRIQEVAGTTHTQWGISMTAGDVYTIAGSSSGSSGHSGDAGAATSALLDGPTGVAVDGAGDLYIADQTNNRIQEVAATTGTQWGISMTANDIYTVAGSSSGTSGHSGDSGAATSALLDQPRNLTLDASGNLYIADTTNNRVQVVAKSTCSSGCPFGLSSTTANDIYTIAGSSSGTSGSTGDGGAPHRRC